MNRDFSFLDRFVNRVLEVFRENLVSIILFGSYARGDNDPTSDIDLLIIFKELPENDYEIHQLLYGLCFESDSPECSKLSFILKDLWGSRVFSPLYFDISEDGIILFDRNFFSEILRSIRSVFREMNISRKFYGTKTWIWDFRVQGAYRVENDIETDITIRIPTPFGDMFINNRKLSELFFSRAKQFLDLSMKLFETENRRELEGGEYDYIGKLCLKSIDLFIKAALVFIGILCPKFGALSILMDKLNLFNEQFRSCINPLISKLIEINFDEKIRCDELENDKNFVLLLISIASSLSQCVSQLLFFKW